MLGDIIDLQLSVKKCKRQSYYLQFMSYFGKIDLEVKQLLWKGNE